MFHLNIWDKNKEAKCYNKDVLMSFESNAKVNGCKIKILVIGNTAEEKVYQCGPFLDKPKSLNMCL